MKKNAHFVIFYFACICMKSYDCFNDNIVDLNVVLFSFHIEGQPELSFNES